MRATSACKSRLLTWKPYVEGEMSGAERLAGHGHATPTHARGQGRCSLGSCCSPSSARGTSPAAESQGHGNKGRLRPSPKEQSYSARFLTRFGGGEGDKLSNFSAFTVSSSVRKESTAARRRRERRGRRVSRVRAAGADVTPRRRPGPRVHFFTLTKQSGVWILTARRRGRSWQAWRGPACIARGCGREA